MRVKTQNRSKYEKAFPDALSRGPSLSPRRDAALVVRLWPGAGLASCPVSSQAPPPGSEGHQQCLLSEVLTVSPFLSSAHQGHLLGELTSCIRQRVTGCYKGYTVETQASAQQRAQAVSCLPPPSSVPCGKPASLGLDG